MLLGLRSPRQPLARLGPSPATSIPTAQQVDESDGGPARVPFGRQDSNLFGLEMTKTSTFPPVMDQYLLPGSRCISMHDAALDVLQSTYVATASQPQLPPPPMPHPPARCLTLAPAAASGPADRPSHGPKGKEKMYHRLSNDVQVPIQSGFTYRKNIGYVCVACGRLCPQPQSHHTVGGGGGCVDLSGNPWRDFAGEGMSTRTSSVYQAHTPPPRDSTTGKAEASATPVSVGQMPQRQRGGMAFAGEEVDEGRRLSEGAGLFF